MFSRSSDFVEYAFWAEASGYETSVQDLLQVPCDGQQEYHQTITLMGGGEAGEWSFVGDSGDSSISRSVGESSFICSGGDEFYSRIEVGGGGCSSLLATVYCNDFIRMPDGMEVERNSGELNPVTTCGNEFNPLECPKNEAMFGIVQPQCSFCGFWPLPDCADGYLECGGLEVDSVELEINEGDWMPLTTGCDENEGKVVI